MASLADVFFRLILTVRQDHPYGRLERQRRVAGGAGDCQGLRRGVVDGRLCFSVLQRRWLICLAGYAGMLSFDDNNPLEASGQNHVAEDPEQTVGGHEP